MVTKKQKTTAKAIATQKSSRPGWVVRDIQTGKYVHGDPRYLLTAKVSKAHVFSTRTEARGLITRGVETVDKVALNSGKAAGVIK